MLVVLRIYIKFFEANYHLIDELISTIICLAYLGIKQALRVPELLVTFYDNNNETDYLILNIVRSSTVGLRLRIPDI